MAVANDISYRFATAIFVSLFFLLATMSYLIMGIVFNLWHPGWVVFPIGGMLSGIVNILLAKK